MMMFVTKLELPFQCSHFQTPCLPFPILMGFIILVCSILSGNPNICLGRMVLLAIFMNSFQIFQTCKVSIADFSRFSGLFAQYCNIHFFIIYIQLLVGMQFCSVFICALFLFNKHIFFLLVLTQPLFRVSDLVCVFLTASLLCWAWIEIKKLIWRASSTVCFLESSLFCPLIDFLRYFMIPSIS